LWRMAGRAAQGHRGFPRATQSQDRLRLFLPDRPVLCRSRRQRPCLRVAQHRLPGTRHRPYRAPHRLPARLPAPRSALRRSGPQNRPPAIRPSPQTAQLPLPSTAFPGMSQLSRKPAMDEVLKASPLESPAAESRRWIGRFLIAVVLGEAIWGFLVSITPNLAQPGMSRVLGADPQSPLYLGRGDINVPALFTSVLELCFAGIVAVILSAWTQKAARTRTVVVRQGPVAVPRQAPAPSAAPGPS